MSDTWRDESKVTDVTIRFADGGSHNFPWHYFDEDDEISIIFKEGMELHPKVTEVIFRTQVWRRVDA